MSRKQSSQKQAHQQRRNERRQQTSQLVEEFQIDIRPQLDRRPIEGKTTNQERYINAIKNYTLTFATGPAGTGKTWLATALAAQALMNKSIDTIIITRPAIEAGENLGFLPGEIDEKFDPYLAPFKCTLIERLGKGFTELLIKQKRIEAAPLAYMRGRSFRKAMIILDEAQNTTPVQMKMFLTRIGEDCKVVINGDIAQQDIRGPSGLADAIDRCTWIPSVRHIEFNRADIVRSGLVADIVASYEGRTPLTTQ